MRRLNNAADQAADSRMIRVAEASEPRVLPVSRQRILNEVVCADAEKVNHRRKLIGNDRRRRRFDHDPLLRQSAFYFLRTQFFVDSLYERAHLQNFLCRGDHRVHDRKPALRRRAQQRAQLRAEDLPPYKAQPDTAQPERRIFFLVKLKISDLLVCADVHRPDDHALALHEFQNAAVYIVLLLLGGIILTAKE